MKNKALVLLLLLSGLRLSAQVREVAAFEKAVTRFMAYDLGKTLPKADSTSARLRKNLDATFLAFLTRKDSNDLTALKSASTGKAGSTYIFGNTTYSFSVYRRNPYVRTFENNVLYYDISFDGVYDYALNNFVHLYLQPFQVGAQQYVVYSYSLNGAGVYYIKEVARNAVVFRATTLTSTAALLTFQPLDEQHVLLVENMQEKGQRALVVQKEGTAWQAVAAFKGNAFPKNATTYARKENKGARTYLRLASTKALEAHYGDGLLTKYGIKFDEQAKTISYQPYTGNESDTKTVQAKWVNNSFTLDDYYLGEKLADQDVPMPR
ncbi:MAG: hypothetical protein ACRYFX_22075 [Janthinobacterium lividum]